VLQDKYQGFLDPRVQDDYLYYADTMFAQLGDLVDQWMTFNEVISICELGYERDLFAPGVSAWAGGRAHASAGLACWLCHNHGMAAVLAIVGGSMHTW
jgi:beta-glucosidase/6-phospho-beta-glucosidase/beta-galactosidase